MESAPFFTMTSATCQLPPLSDTLRMRKIALPHLKYGLSLFVVLLTCFGSPRSHAALTKEDWPAWRGLARDSIAAEGQNPPLKWSETESILWKTAIPGHGHGSPIMVGNQIYLPTGDRQKRSQSILGLNRTDGKILWQTEVHASGAEFGNQAHSSTASPTIACDGERLYINFANSGAIYTTALDLQGKQVWQRKVCDFVIHQDFAASPVLHESIVIVAADHRGGGMIAGLDKKTGNVVWTYPRPKLPNYTTPAIVHAAGRTQMVISGCNKLTSLDPLSGKKLWEIDGSTEECVTTMVTDGERVFASGGYPKNHVAAVMADGSGKITWQNTARVYVPSMIAKEGHIYSVMDAGMAVCWKSDTGKELWKERLGGEFFASPTMVGNRIYASNTAGKTYVFEATPEAFKLLAQNQLGDEANASPVICDNRIYLRVAKKGEPRQEFLYCIGEKK